MIFAPNLLTAFAGQVFAVSAIRIIPSLVMLVSYGLLARLYPVADIGLYLIVYGIAATVGTWITIGMPDGVVPLFARHDTGSGERDLRPTVRVTATIVAALSLALFVVAMTLSWFVEALGHTMSARLQSVVVWSALAAGPFALSFLFSQMLLGLGRRRLAIALFFWPAPLMVSIVALTAWFSATVPPLALLLAALPVAWLSGAAAGALLVVRTLGPKTHGSAPADWKESVRMGLPMLGTRSVINIEAWAPIWLSGLLLSVQDAGIVGAALRLLGGLMAVPQAFGFVSRATIPQLISRNDLAGLEAFMRTLGLLVGGMVAIVALFALVFGQSAMSAAFGSHYAEGGVVLTLYCGAFAVQYLTGSVDMALMMGGYERFLFWVNLGSVPFTIAGLAAGFIWYGMLGGAAAFLFTHSVKFVLLVIAARRAFGYWSIPTVDRGRLRHGAKIFAGGRAPGR